jgi:Skp family chaperone for outer membrane proteins
MKKIIAVLTLLTAFAFSSHAQQVAPEVAGKNDVTELNSAVQLDKTQFSNFEKLFTTKHKMLADANMDANKKNKVLAMFEKRIETGLNPDQLKKLQDNKALFEKLTK